jgi:UDP-N-acetylglucosamine--N-acetylmuramyl-(pentapeptide) pyrophosphoryl-undecaprenol N-acetylglucosamine transferase
MKILVACGGTGGHIFPALSFLKDLKLCQNNCDILLVVTRRTIEKQIIPEGYKIAHISLLPVKLKLDKENIVSILKLVKGAFESIKIIIRFRPDLVIGFGGYASFLLVFFAWALGVKTLIHEQNVIMGRANRALAPFVDRIAISFSQTKDYISSYRDKLFLTGNPLRPGLIRLKQEEALDFFGFSKDRFTILIMGGSLGAHKINMEFFKTVSLIKDRVNFQIVHLCGVDDFDFLNDGYKNINIIAKVFKFLDQMQYAYSGADLVICRGGALTVSELIFFQLPAIIIPYPYAYAHQLANAKVLTDIKCAILIEDKSLNALELGNILIKLFSNPDKLNNMRFNYKGISQELIKHRLSDVVTSLNK